jgi:hypothetical protein
MTAFGPRFAPGHGGFKRKGPTARDQRRAQYHALVQMTLAMAADVAAGRAVDPVIFQRSLNLQIRLERKGYGR